MNFNPHFFISYLLTEIPAVSGNCGTFSQREQVKSKKLQKFANSRLRTMYGPNFNAKNNQLNKQRGS